MNRDEVVNVLEKAKARIKPRGRWAKGWFAYNANSDRVSLGNPNAVKWCAFGSVYCETSKHLDTYMDTVTYLAAAAREMGFASIDILNDRGGKRRTLEAFDRAIKLAKADAS